MLDAAYIHLQDGTATLKMYWRNGKPYISKDPEDSYLCFSYMDACGRASIMAVSFGKWLTLAPRCPRPFGALSFTCPLELVKKIKNKITDIVTRVCYALGRLINTDIIRFLMLHTNLSFSRPQSTLCVIYSAFAWKICYGYHISVKDV